jgi:hypothetical protein
MSSNAPNANLQAQVIATKAPPFPLPVSRMTCKRRSHCMKSPPNLQPPQW